MTTLELRYASVQTMRHACRFWHYSRSVPTPPLLPLAVLEDGSLRGVVVFSRGNAPQIARPFGIRQTQVCELTRIALREHRTPVSRIVRVALVLLRRQSPGVDLVVSFADPDQGHHGGIYQALGWTYLGQMPPTRIYVDAAGRRWHSRMISASGTKKVYGRSRPVLRPSDCEVVLCAGKHKYAHAFERDLQALVAERSQPYPKRAADPTEERRRPAGAWRFDSDPAALGAAS